MCEIHYKIVSVRKNGRRMSFNYDDDCATYDNPRDLEYKIGEWTIPKINSPLFVFATLEGALKYLDGFLIDIKSVEIYTCEVDGKPRDIDRDRLLICEREDNRDDVRLFNNVKLLSLVHSYESMDKDY